jgi:diguanylate cyclase (GGDEF)-like protein/PAS domain S-box-containing protein
MLQVIRTRIAYRSALTILAVFAGVGLALSLALRALAIEHEDRKQNRQLGQLLETVAATTAEACYLQNRPLAEEVAAGLLKNAIVAEVVIRTPQGVLARLPRPRPEDASFRPGPGALVHPASSPFDPEQMVGEVILVPNLPEIRRQAIESANFLRYPLLLQSLVVALAVVLVVLRMVTRPILVLSARLHGLKAELGEKLDSPAGHEQDEIGRLVGDVNVLIDQLVGRLESEHQLRLAQEVEKRKFLAIFDQVGSGIFILDQNFRVISGNRAFRRIFGLAPGAGTEEEPFSLRSLLGEEAPALLEKARECLRDGTVLSRDLRLPKGLEGGAGWVHLNLACYEQGRLLGVLNDVTQRKLAEEMSLELAVRDPLTGVSNRRGFDARLEWLEKACARDPQRAFSILFVDLDHFKEVNDTFGHDAGDLVLQAVARILEGAVRKADFVARLGGDEFALLMDLTGSREVLAGVAGKILEALREPIALGKGNQARVGASIGIASWRPEAGGVLDLGRILKAADAAMYAAKQGGRNNYIFGDD